MILACVQDANDRSRMFPRMDRNDVQTLCCELPLLNRRPQAFLNTKANCWSPLHVFGKTSYNPGVSIRLTGPVFF